MRITFLNHPTTQPPNYPTTQLTGKNSNMKTGIIQKLICGIVVAWFAFGVQADPVPSAEPREQPTSHSESTNKLADATSPNDVKHYGLWLFGKNMNDADLHALGASGVTDVLLHDYAITCFGQPAVEAWIEKANALGIQVHIWVQAFYDGKWKSPAQRGNPKLALFGKILAHAKQCARIRGVAGIHFDYLRSGGMAYKIAGSTAAITRFAKFAVQHLHQVNPKLIVSGAIMPETTETAYYYGQDYEELSRYLDVVIPMIYKGNFRQDSPWIEKTTKWYVKHSKGAEVWIGLQGFRGPKNATKLPPSELAADLELARKGSPDRILLFRWGASHIVPLKPEK